MSKEYYYLCWVDNINFLSLLLIIFLRATHNYKEIRYLSFSKLAEKIICKLKLDSYLRIKSVREDDFEMTSHEEMEIYNNGCYIEKSSLAIDIAKRASIKDRLLTNLDSRYNKSKIVFSFKREIACDIEEFTIISNFIKWYCAKNKNLETIRHIVIIKGNVWRHYLRFYKKDLVWRIYTYLNLKKMIETHFIPIKIILEICANSLLLFLTKKRIKYISNPTTPKIGVLHAHGADLEKRSDYFWFNNSSIDPQRILVYFKYHCWPAKKESIMLIESYGMHWVNLLPWKFSKLRILSAIPEFYKIPHPLYIKNSIITFLQIAKLFFCCLFKLSNIALWQWRHLANLLNRVTLYEAFFSLYNIKMHYGIYEAGMDMIAANIAIELVGGIDLCHHWSNFDVIEICIGKPHDVYFSWGPYYERHFFDKNFYEMKYLVYTGYPYDYHFPRCKQKAQLYRQRLLENGAKFIVCFFDQRYSYFWPKANKDIEDIYRALLHKVLQDSDFGLITKPKKIRNFWEIMPNLSSLAKEAEKTGRCFFLDGSTSTNVAAQASDLAIGFGVYSTPAIESAISGIPAITCDLQGLVSHPFYKEGYNSIVFNDLDTMMQSIQQFKNRNNNSDGFADYSFSLKDIDPFRDGRASERVGFFMKWLLDEFDKGKYSQQVVEKAVERYRTEWGTDKVISFQKEKREAV